MTIPLPVLDDRSFDQLVAEAKARIPVHTPEWTNLNSSDPGVTIVELFAFLTDNLLYRSNRIPEANRKKFLSMLGISLQPASPGQGLVTVSNDKGPLEPPLGLAPGTEVRAGQVPFLTTTGLGVLPVSSAVFYKKPQNPDAATQSRYQLLYQTFLDQTSDVLSFYQPVALDPPATGKADPVVDLGDPVSGTIDRSLWMALLAPKGADLDAVRRALAGQTLSVGVYPAAAVAGEVLSPPSPGGSTVDPGLVFEIAAPEADPTGMAGPGFGVGPANYARLPVTYADPVLVAPGVVQVTLPPYERILLWDFDPEEEGTGDYPPRLDDAGLKARLVTWIRVRFPTTSGTTSGGSGQGSSTGASSYGCGCGCGCGGSSNPRSASPGSTTPVAPPASATPVGPAAGSGTDETTVSGCGCGCGCAGGAMAAPAPSTSQVLAADAAGDQPTGRLTWVGVNAAAVIQAVPVVHESLGLGTGTPFQTFRLANSPVIVDGQGEGLLFEVDGPDGWQAWSPIDDIYAAAPDDLRYQLDPASGTVTVGSGLFGSRAALGRPVRASYRYGGGLQGQVPIGSVTKSVALPGGFSVNNPVATWGASDAESVADGEASITRWLRHRDRLVTAQDFSDLTLRTPGVDLGRVEVLPLFNPDQADPTSSWPGMVTVLVIPRSDPLTPATPVPDRQFLGSVCAWLAPRRLVTTELHVRGPEYQPLWVSVGIEVLAGQVPALVRQAVTAAVTQFLSPLTGGLPVPDSATGIIGAGPSSTGTGWPLWTDVRTNDIEAVATRVPGVRYVDSVRIAATDAGGAVVASVDPVPMAGLQLPAATVFCNLGPAEDPAALIGTSQPVLPTQVPVPLVPPTC